MRSVKRAAQFRRDFKRVKRGTHDEALELPVAEAWLPARYTDSPTPFSKWRSLRAGLSCFAPSPGKPGLGPFGLRSLSRALRRLHAGSLAAYLRGRHRIAANASQIFPKVRAPGMRTQPGTRSGKKCSRKRRLESLTLTVIVP